MTSPLRVLRLLAITLMVVLAPVSVGVYRLAYGGDVPDPVPTHWGPRGQVDGTTGLTAFTVAALGVTTGIALAGLVGLALARRYAVAVAGLVAAAWAGWLMATTYAATLTAAAGAETADEVPLRPFLVVAIVLVPTLVAAVVWLLVPFTPRGAAAVETPPSPISVRDDERITWVGQASSTALLVLGLVLVLAAVGTVFVLWPLALALGVAGFAITWVHRVLVRVDNTAVTVAWGPGRWPRLTVPLSEVTAAHATSIEPLWWGGWGYRVTPRGHAAVVRRGPGLVLSRRDRSPFAVTVDAPEGAADVVNAVIAHHATPPPTQAKQG